MPRLMYNQDKGDDTVIPKDPMILLSFVNTKLRDQYPTLDALCEDLNVQRDALEQTLAALDFRYSEEQNRFI